MKSVRERTHTEGVREGVNTPCASSCPSSRIRFLVLLFHRNDCVIVYYVRRRRGLTRGKGHDLGWPHFPVHRRSSSISEPVVRSPSRSVVTLPSSSFSSAAVRLLLPLGGLTREVTLDLRCAGFIRVRPRVPLVQPRGGCQACRWWRRIGSAATQRGGLIGHGGGENFSEVVCHAVRDGRTGPRSRNGWLAGRMRGGQFDTLPP